LAAQLDPRLVGLAGQPTPKQDLIALDLAAQPNPTPFRSDLSLAVKPHPIELGLTANPNPTSLGKKKITPSIIFFY
jgi:hypothetical protein